MQEKTKDKMMGIIIPIFLVIFDLLIIYTNYYSIKYYPWYGTVLIDIFALPALGLFNYVYYRAFIKDKNK